MFIKKTYLETNSSLDFAYNSGYISTEEYKYLTDQTSEIGKRLRSIIKNPHSFLIDKK
jgi:four helix bundle protein